MKTQTVVTYSAPELKEKLPRAFERALEDYRNSSQESDWTHETIDSLKSLIQAAGLRMKDWSLGAYNRNNFLKTDISDDAGELFGKRAFAWIENNLLSSLRVPWTGKERAEVRQYGSAYYAGKIKPCPFTGYCADDEYLEELQNSIASGRTLKESFEDLADTCQSILERESEYQSSEGYFMEHAEANEMQFTEDGELF